MRRNLTAIAIAHLVISVRACPASAADERELLDLVRSGHQAAIQSIHTLSCRVSLTSIPQGPSASPTGEYWRSSDSVRVRWHHGNESHDTVRDDFRIRSVTTTRTPGGHRTVRATVGPDTRQPLGMCDAWSLALLTFPGEQPGVVLTFDELLKKPNTLHRVDRQTDGVHELVHVDLEHDSARLEIWFDPRANYLPRRTIVTSAQPLSGGKPLRSEASVARFKEVAPTIYFPEKVEAQYYHDNRRVYAQVITFSDLRVNQSLPPDTFRLRFPSGARVADQFKGKAYKVGEDGNPLGGETDLATAPPLSAGAGPRSETQTEPQPLTRWILPTSLGILVLACCLWLARKWKRPT